MSQGSHSGNAPEGRVQSAPVSRTAWTGTQFGRAFGSGAASARYGGVLLHLQGLRRRPEETCFGRLLNKFEAIQIEAGQPE